MLDALVENERLLQGISEESPCGDDPRNDPSPFSLFRQMKDAREEARRLERQSDLNGDGFSEATSHWRTVSEKALQLLEEKAKDLEAAAYLIESQIRLNGFAGLSFGLDIAASLVERFWGELYPEPDEDGVETTLLPISRLDGDVLSDAIKRVPATTSGPNGPLRFWQYRQAQDLEKFSADERQERLNRGAVDLSMFQLAVLETPSEFFNETQEGLQASQQSVEKLADILRDRAGNVAPSFSRIRESLEEAAATLRLLAGNRLTSAEATSGDPSSSLNGVNHAPVATGVGAAASVPSVNGGIANRETAFQILLQVADFFEKTEPQSLLPAEIRKAVRRGKMKPEELYRDLINDSSVLEQMFRDVGIPLES